MAAKKLTTIISTLQASNFCLQMMIKLFYSDFYQFSSMGLRIRKFFFKISLKTPDTFYSIF